MKQFFGLKSAFELTKKGHPLLKEMWAERRKLGLKNF